MRFLLTQSGRGEASILRLVQTALQINSEMVRRGQERYRILVPWSGGERQRQSLRTAFLTDDKKYPGELLLDERLGRMLSLFNNTDMSYAATMALWIAGWEDAGRQVRDHYNRDITVTDLHGQSVAVAQPAIALELNESPRFHIGVALSYQVTPCRPSQLIDTIASRPIGAFGLGRDLTNAARDVIGEIERNLCRTYTAIPGLFAPPDRLLNHNLDQDFVPLTSTPLVTPIVTIPPSAIYVTTSEKCAPGDPLRTVFDWRVPVFTNNPAHLGGGEFADVAILKHPNIQFHFTHARWEAVAASLQCEKPTLVCNADPIKDPEAYLNCEKLEGWGMVRVYRGQPFEQLQAELYVLKPQLKLLLKNLNWRFGSTDGSCVAARKIVDELLK